MKYKLIDLLLLLAAIVIVLLAFWELRGAGSAEQEPEAVVSEPVKSPCPDVVPMDALELAAEPAADPDKPTYDPAIPLSEDIQYILWAACEENDVNPVIALGLIEVESGFNPDADNGLCYGLMQLNCKYFPGGLPAGENIQYGVEYLGQLLIRYGSVEGALTTYNAGYDTGSRVYANAVLAVAEKWREPHG